MGVFEGFLTGEVERNNNAVGLPIKGVRQISESVLACGVPQLDNNLVAILRNIVGLDEIHPSGSDVLGLELPLVESFQKRRLPHFTITDDDN